MVHGLCGQQVVVCTSTNKATIVPPHVGPVVDVDYCVSHVKAMLLFFFFFLDSKIVASTRWHVGWWLNNKYVTANRTSALQARVYKKRKMLSHFKNATKIKAKGHILARNKKITIIKIRGGGNHVIVSGYCIKAQKI